MSDLNALPWPAGSASRPAAVHHAVRMLRLPDLEQDYEAAWAEWQAADDEAAWGATVSDEVRDVAQ